MNQKMYGYLTTGCVIVAFISAIAFDAVVAYRWIPGMIGVLSGLTAVGLILYWKNK